MLTFYSYSCMVSIASGLLVFYFSLSIIVHYCQTEFKLTIQDISTRTCDIVLCLTNSMVTIIRISWILFILLVFFNYDTYQLVFWM